MREAVMSPGLFVARTTERERARPEDRSLKQAGGWNPEDFAREQIRGLVRQVFLSNVERPVRQVVFSAVEPETDVQNLCWRVGEALARETEKSIAVIGECPEALQDAETYAAEMTEHPVDDGSTARRQAATRVGGNLWLVPPAGNQRDQVTTALLHSYLGGMRTQFEYTIVVGPPAAESNAATAMAQLADGIVLVLSAHYTRRITARKIKEKLEAAQALVLGTVLSDRVFPIPEGIYRRL
jgi:succinoglycan biosynthesis transport protein ExoP